MDFIDSAVEKGNNQYDDSIELGKKFPKDTKVKYIKALDKIDEKFQKHDAVDKEGKVEYPLDNEKRISILFGDQLVIWDLTKDKEVNDMKKYLKKKGMFGNYSGGKKTRRLKKGGILGFENQGIFKDTNERLNTLLNDLAQKYAKIRQQPNSRDKAKQILDIKIELLKIIKRGDKYAADWIKNCKCKDEQDIIGDRSDKTVEIIGFLNSSIESLAEANIEGMNENQKLNLKQLTDENIPFDYEKAIQETETAKKTATSSTGGKSNRTKRGGKKIRRKTNKRKTNKRRSRK